MSVITAEEYLDALAMFEQVTDRLAAADPVMLSSQQVLDSLRRLETAARTVPYSQNLLAGVAFEQGLPAELGYTGLKELLVDQLRLAGAEARDRMHGAHNRVPRHARGFAPESYKTFLRRRAREQAATARYPQTA